MRRRSWCRGSARLVPNAWLSDCRRLARKPLSESHTGHSERSADRGAGDPVDREGALDIGPLYRAVGASALDSLGIEQYSRCPSVDVGITDPDPETVG